MAYGALIGAALSSVRMHFAVRIAALALTRGHDRAAALAALEAERDAALAQLAERLKAEKHRALRQVRRARRRYRIAPPRFGLRYRPRRPARYPSP